MLKQIPDLLRRYFDRSSFSQRIHRILPATEIGQVTRIFSQYDPGELYVCSRWKA